MCTPPPSHTDREKSSIDLLLFKLGSDDSVGRTEGKRNSAALSTFQHFSLFSWTHKFNMTNMLFIKWCAQVTYIYMHMHTQMYNYLTYTQPWTWHFIKTAQLCKFGWTMLLISCLVRKDLKRCGFNVYMCFTWINRKLCLTINACTSASQDALPTNEKSAHTHTTTKGSKENKPCKLPLCFINDS